MMIKNQLKCNCNIDAVPGCAKVEEYQSNAKKEIKVKGYIYSDSFFWISFSKVASSHTRLCGSIHIYVDSYDIFSNILLKPYHLFSFFYSSHYNLNASVAIQIHMWRNSDTQKAKFSFRRKGWVFFFKNIFFLTWTFSWC